MNPTRRSWRLATAALVSAGLLGTGVAIGASTADPAEASRPAATSPAAVTGTTSYSSVVRQVVPSVVQIRTQDGLGSGVILDDKGHIVTNAHVTGDATRFQVQLADDPAPRSAHLVGSYRPDDLAVIRADDADGLKPARLGDSSLAKPGDVVLAVGNPLGLTSSITDGIISATGRAVTEPGSAEAPAATLPNAIQTSAAINPGNSGGALVNLAGEVIGIPTLAAASPGNGAPAPGIGFAIPSNVVKDIAGQIIESGHVTDSHRAAIGAQITTTTNADGTPAGVGIVAVTAGGAADRAGLRAGDVIRSLGSTETPTGEALAQALAGMRPGQHVTATVVRDGSPRDVELTLGQLPGS
jgi:S1-C subfamily serine protease